MARSHLLCAALLAACGPSKDTTAPPIPAGSSAASEAGPCPAATLPDSPAGQRTATFLAALADDTTEIEAVIDEQLAPSFRDMVPMAVHVDVLGGFREQTGGVTVCRVEYEAGTEAQVLLGAHRSDELHLLTVRVDESAPHLVSSLAFEAASRELLEHPAPPLDDAARHAVVEGVAGALDGYIFADVAAAMQDRIRSERDAGHYRDLTHGVALARRLATDLRDVSHDKHLSIRYSTQVLPAEAPEEQPPSAEQLAEMRAEAAQQGFGIARVDVLAGNIGYVDVRRFFPVELVEDGITEAMTTIADTKALIVDLRLNHGGDPATVAFMTSYLFGNEKVHLNDLYYRNTNQTFEYWTDPTVPGKRFGQDKPVYVLTSGETFSGGEEFANNLRELGRATVIGEPTGGGAHPVGATRVDDHFLVILPMGRAINPISKSNWEGKGVQPHVAVPADQAMDRALEMIAAKKK